MVNIIDPGAVKGGDHPVDQSGHQAHEYHGGEQDQGGTPGRFVLRGIGQRVGQHPVPGRPGHQKYHQKDAADHADEENDIQRDDALDQELEQYGKTHPDAGDPAGTAASLERHGVVVIDAAADVAAGEQAQRGAQGKQRGLIGGEEQDGGGHAQRPCQEGGVFPSLLSPDQFAQQGKRQKSQAGADQAQGVNGVDPPRAEQICRPGIDRRFCQHEGQEAQGKADGLEPLFPGEIPNGIVFPLCHVCFTSPQRKDHVPVLTDHSG